MKKIWIGFLSVMMLVVAGYGTESSDPTARISSLAAEPSSVAPGDSAVIKVHVVKVGMVATTTTGAGTTTATTDPNAWGVDVTFRLLTANDGRLSAAT